jgi:two-component system sensor histidine kinase QseC
VAGLIQSERRFTADASHELRTPLAALKTQAQVARASANEAERAHALDQVILGCDRATHLLQQLLTLARLDPEQPGRDKVRFNLRDLAKSAIADMAPFALSRNIDIGLSEGAAVDVLGYPGLVAIMLRNLIDNAIRYSPAGGNVCVQASGDGQAATVSVSDEGPGIAPEERSKVGQRFYRILGSGESGSGLGLSIVNRIAELHGATLALEDGSNGKGLSVAVTFGL